ncbi:SDR family oxidoreductase [Staphylococcus capitis]|uniref:SDR family oxidoreductase n=1 Tax=Staphylococcus capitis TaxID=29388 RepID=UPI0037D49581
MKRLENKIVVVTGASTGIGQGSAKVLANEGAHVLALDISDKLDDTVKEINEAGGQATAYKVDISNEHQVEQFAEEAKDKYGRENIRANAIAPGTIETPLVDNLAGTSEDEAVKTFRENQKWVTPLGRLGTPDEVGKLVTFLASDDSSFITGETIRIDGGVMAYTWPGEMLSDDSWKNSTK